MTTADLTSAVKKNPLIVGCAVLTLALGAMLYLRLDSIPEANSRLDELSAQSRRYALNISNASQLKEHMDALIAANKAIDGRVIRSTDIGINQQFFYKLESESGVKLLDLRQGGKPATKTNFAPVGFTVSLQGDFPQVLKFLRGLEDGSHYARVLTASCSGTRTGDVTMTLSLELLGRP
jgi:hypothetical protein